jgi:hypothetical protein
MSDTRNLGQFLPNRMYWPIKALIFPLIELIARKRGESLTF